MKFIARNFLILFLAVFFAVAASADVYQWTDQDGTVNFSDNFDNIPVGLRSKARNVQGLRPTAARLRSDIVSDELQVPFERRGGILFVDVVINDSVPAKMIFDTGASRVTIGQGLWQRMNPDEEQSGLGRKVKLHTAGGIVDGMSLTIERIKLGEASRENVEAILNPTFDRYDGLLGMSFLEDYLVTIDNENNKIILKKKEP
jgi:clan AA aspartic protease (TIGR02281 family)